VTDTFVGPFPPDSVLILIAASPYHKHWLWLLPAIGAVSTLAGCVGYCGGRFLSHKPWAQRWFGALHSKSEERVKRYGAWAVAIGAMTPVPFSITCWTAGLIRMEFRDFLPPALLRIPRYVLYYAAIAYFPRLFG
jgi:membrane protein YqaA with SNARE-associated domain